jgi:hypothetical protein
MGYGRDDLYTRWSVRSLQRWKTLAEIARQTIFHETGVLWLAGEGDSFTQQSQETLEKGSARLAHRFFLRS